MSTSIVDPTALASWLPATEPKPPSEPVLDGLHDVLLERRPPRKGRPPEDGELLVTEGNLDLILRYCPAWSGVLAHNELSCQDYCRVAPPWHDIEHEGEQAGAAWSDSDSVRLRLWLAAVWGIQWPTARAVEPLVHLAALRVPSHPVCDYLDALVWDGEERLPTWLSAYLGAEPSQYAADVGTWWMISAVARIQNPGCQVDHLLILEGAQGIGKSATVRILGGDWFSEGAIDYGSKDRFLALRGQWIVELSELDGMTAATAARLKAYISAATDSYRPPYARAVQAIPRQCVFVGTTNDETYLRDATGGRRFWPVRCGVAEDCCGEIAVDELAEARDQLWAEALVRYHRGERWWPVGPEAQLCCAEQQEARYQDDGWTDCVLEWAQQQTRPFGSVDALTQAVELKLADVHRGHQMRVGRILLRGGFDRRRHTVKGRRCWLYEPTSTSSARTLPF